MQASENQLLKATIPTLATWTLAAMVGWLSGFSFYAALVLVGAVVFLGFLTLGERVVPIFLVSLGLLLAGYAFGGRGFAYIGLAPIFVGELVLFLASLVILVKLSRVQLRPIHLLLVGFMIWGLVRTLPYLQRDGVDALRDAVIWGYAFFAIAISLAVRPDHLPVISKWYGKIAPFFVCWVPIFFVLHNNFQLYLPKAPGSNVTIPFFQADGVAVHLAGIASFALIGLYSSQRNMKMSWAIGLGLVWLIALLICSSVSRGGLLAAVLALVTAYALHPSRIWLPITMSAVLTILVLLLINPSFHVENRPRDVSARQVVANSLSIFSGSEESHGELEGTKGWRLRWWNKIFDYTFRGPYFWTGKGFGINLANDDGFLQSRDRSLRSPHNTHIAILARMGVPGLALWVAMNAVFVSTLWTKRRIAERTGQTFRSAFIAWLLTYWVGMTAAGAFSLYLESPHVAIWFWTVFGLGLAVIVEEDPGESQRTNSDRAGQEPVRIQLAAAPKR